MLLSNTLRKILSIIAFYFLVMGYFSEGLWKFFPASFFMSFVVLAKERSFCVPSWDDLIKILVLFFCLLLGSYLLQKGITASQGIDTRWEHPREYLLLTIGQVYAEEIYLRCVLLSSILALPFNKNTSLILLALVFACAHYFLYFLIAGKGISLLALGTLFIFTHALNLIYLETQSVLMPMCFHLAWNVPRFFLVRYARDGQIVNEVDLFDVIEGHWLTFILAGLIFMGRKKFARLQLSGRR